MTLTLPNHTGMVTSRRIDRSRGGHGVIWNDDRLRPRTVQAAAGHPVGSVFSSLETAGLGSALFAAKPKFSLFNRSWPKSIDHTLIRADNASLVEAVRERPGDHLASPHVPAHLAARRRRSRPRLDVAGVPQRGPPVRLPGRPGPRHDRRDGRVARPHPGRRHRRPRRPRSRPLRPTQSRRLPDPLPGLGPRRPGRRRPLRPQPDVRRPRQPPRRIRHGEASRSATATSATWSSTCSACPRSPTASSTSTRTSRSSPPPDRWLRKARQRLSRSPATRQRTCRSAQRLSRALSAH